MSTPSRKPFADEAHARAVASVLRHALAQRHDHGLRLLRRLSAFGGRAVRRSRAAPHADDRRQMHDGPQRAASFARYSEDRLRRVRGAGREWHGKERLLYAITPRWAGSSTEAQLEAAGALWREHPELHVQTHIALFVLMTGDDRGVRATYVAGQLEHRRQPVDA